jgi:hypothetical protein
MNGMPASGELSYIAVLNKAAEAARGQSTTSMTSAEMKNAVKENKITPP